MKNIVRIGIVGSNFAADFHRQAGSPWSSLRSRSGCYGGAGS
jgi:hypothetical protein